MAGKTIAEHLAGLKATRDSLMAKMNDTFQKSVDEGRSMNTAEAEEHDEAESQIKALDADIARATRMEAIAGQTAKPVDTTAVEKAAVRPGFEPATIRTVEKLEPGIAFARYVQCLGRAKGNKELAFKFAVRHYPDTEAVVKTLKAQAEGADLREMMKIKATIPAGTTTDETWAAPLVYANTFTGDFIEYLRPRTLIGQAQFEPIPFNVRVESQTSGGTSRWVGQGKSKPLTKFDFNQLFSSYSKVAVITVLTDELIRLSGSAAEARIRNSLADSVIERIDSDLFDPDVAAVANVNPAGLLNGIAPVTGPTGSDPDDIRCALLRLWAPWDATNLGSRPAYYTTPAVARWLAFMRDALGNVAFPGMTPMGGSLDGIPVRVSQYLANNGGSSGAPFILVDEREVYLADDGAVTIDTSNEATIEMSDTPVGSSSATVTSNGSPFVSMFQTDSTAYRAERWIWWGLRRTGAVQWIDGFPSSC